MFSKHQYKVLKKCLKSASWHSKRIDFTQGMKNLIARHYKYQCANSVPNFVCDKAGRELRHWHIDHIVPARVGGKPIFENAQVLCLDCHAEKSLLENKFFPKKGSKNSYYYGSAKKWIKSMLIPKPMS